jgi:hypothetical protein
MHWKHALEGGGRFTLHEAAEAVLLSFGGLRLGERGPGDQISRSTVYLDPAVAIGEEDRFCDYFERLRGRDVFPLGEIDDGHAFLGIDRAGRVYLLMDEVFAEWPSFEAALDALIRGVRSSRRG